MRDSSVRKVAEIGPMESASAMRLSIVVPTLDEEGLLDATLGHLTAVSDDVVVSDGGSTDATEAIARRHPVRWVGGPAGRGGQLNRGAAVARGDTLLFVHADTRLPEGAPRLIEEALANGTDGGAFEIRFVGESRVMAGLGSRLASRRARLTRIPLGDHAHFVRRDLFEAMGGYRDWPILEDVDFMRRLKRRGRVTILPAAVLTSDRRYAERGVARTMAINYLIWALYLAGVDPHRLARLYRQVR